MVPVTVAANVTNFFLVYFRNEVWRYSSFTKINNWGLAKALITRGMKPGFILAVATVVLEKAYDFAFAKDHHHHHQDEGHQ